jgi:hypothetical protein
LLDIAFSPRMVGRKIDTSKSTSHLKKQGQLSETEKAALVKYAHHAEEDKDSDEEKVQYKRISKANKTMVYIPEERMVKVPVVRKEKEKIIEKHTVQGSRLVPVTKYKEVAEVNLHDRAVRPGERAWSGNPKTTVIKTSEMAGRTRKIPYTDFIEEKFDITVDVPREVIKTRVGYRMDKQLHSHAVEIVEDCEYEMRPVLIRKGETKAKQIPDSSVHGKAVHGDPVWDGGLHDGWRPEYGAITPQNTRPGTAYGTMSSRPGTSYSQRPGTGMGSPTGMMGSPTGREELRPIMEFTSRPGTSSRPGTGTRSAPNLHAR